MMLLVYVDQGLLYEIRKSSYKQSFLIDNQSDSIIDMLLLILIEAFVIAIVIDTLPVMKKYQSLSGNEGWFLPRIASQKGDRCGRTVSSRCAWSIHRCCKACARQIQPRNHEKDFGANRL